jgi:TetR/AcrR family tetracycline transcriptional repressor
MAKIRREEVVSAALELLDEVGLDGLSTRRLAQKLGVESASLYWHFRDKATLLGEMASLVLARHHTFRMPEESTDWRVWFADLARSFRRALLAYRDGALLHAGTTPNQEEIAAMRPMVQSLVRAGFTEADAHMALFNVSQYTVGCVLEQQARPTRTVPPTERRAPTERGHNDEDPSAEFVLTPIDPEDAFEFGLNLFVSGLADRLTPDRERR